MSKAAIPRAVGRGVRAEKRIDLTDRASGRLEKSQNGSSDVPETVVLLREIRDCVRAIRPFFEVFRQGERPVTAGWLGPDQRLLAAIYAGIASVSFAVADLVSRSAGDSDFKASLVAARVSVSTVGLGRRLGAVERRQRRGAMGPYRLERLGRDGHGALWSVVRLDAAVDVDAIASVTSVTDSIRAVP
jgi:hypothetical protein